MDEQRDRVEVRRRQVDSSRRLTRAAGSADRGGAFGGRARFPAGARRKVIARHLRAETALDAAVVFGTEHERVADDLRVGPVAVVAIDRLLAIARDRAPATNRPW